jgi:RNA polymerase sigma factor (sigma-70 family)
MLESTPQLNESGLSSDEPSIRTLFEEEEAGLLRYAFSLTGRRAVAEEIVQEVFLQLHKRWQEVDSPRAWLFRSVRNGAFRFLQKSKRERLQSEDEVSGSVVEDSAAPDAEMEKMETNAKLRRLIQELESIDRQLIRLKYFEGLKYREISDRTGLTVSNVGVRLHNILKGLGRRLNGPTE